MELDYQLHKLSPLDSLLVDPKTIEIAVNSDGQVWVERAGDAHMSLSEQCSIPPKEITNIAHVIANVAKLPLTPLSPMISASIDYKDVTLRTQAIIPPASANGSVMAMRLFRRRAASEEPRRFEYLRGQGRSLEAERGEKLHAIMQMARENPDPDAFLKAAVDANLNIIVSGATSSGKTELARRFLWMLPTEQRFALIEDAAELLPANANVVSLIADRTHNSARSPHLLLEATLRLRPDRIILGELRGVEAMTFLEAINTGHDGSFTTIHAHTARKAVERLALLVLRSGVAMNFAEVQQYICSSIDLIIQTGRIGASRGILETYFPALDAGSTLPMPL